MSPPGGSPATLHDRSNQLMRFCDCLDGGFLALQGLLHFRADGLANLGVIRRYKAVIGMLRLIKHDLGNREFRLVPPDLRGQTAARIRGKWRYLSRAFRQALN